MNAARGDATAKAALARVLHEWASEPLVAVVDRLVAGSREPEELTAGLDAPDAAILTEMLRRLQL